MQHLIRLWRAVVAEPDRLSVLWLRTLGAAVVSTLVAAVVTTAAIRIDVFFLGLAAAH
jgi:hypothetical protein